jgi:hypothetical protein
MLAEVRRRFMLPVLVVAIVMVVVSSISHIKASTRMVPVPVSLTDPNSGGTLASPCSAECALVVPVVCIKLTSAALETLLEERGPTGRLSEQQVPVALPA